MFGLYVPCETAESIVLQAQATVIGELLDACISLEEVIAVRGTCSGHRSASLLVDEVAATIRRDKAQHAYFFVSKLSAVPEVSKKQHEAIG